MNITPKTDADLSTGNLLPKGEYDFEITSAADKVSKAGNEMIELKVLIYLDGSPARQIFDYLMDSVAYKVKHFCYGTGLNKQYDEGKLTAFECNAVSGKCKVGIKEDKTGQYPPNNVITDYVVQDKPHQQKKQTNGDKLTEEEDLPF